MRFVRQNPTTHRSSRLRAPNLQRGVSKPDSARTKYINRLTPMTLIGKATEKGLEDVAKTVLGEHFELSDNKIVEKSEGNEGWGKQDNPERTSYSVSWYPQLSMSPAVLI